MPQTVYDLWQEVRKKIAQNLPDQDPSLSALDARLLMQNVLDMTHEELLLEQYSRTVTDEERATLRAYVAQRCVGKPIAKILGRKEFYGRTFKTSEATLDPRPDSEIIVSAAVYHAGALMASSQRRSRSGGDAVKENSGLRQNDEPIEDTYHPSPLRLLDLGTGTGCLVLSILAELRAQNIPATATAIDLSPKALTVAKENARALGLEENITFLQGSWLDSLIDQTSPPQFDLIVSNPPYIPRGDMTKLARDVREYDPELALVGGDDGLDPYRLLCAQLGHFIAPDGLVIFEHGIGQRQDIKAIAMKHHWHTQQELDDLGGRDRGLVLSLVLTR